MYRPGNRDTLPVKRVRFDLKNMNEVDWRCEDDNLDCECEELKMNTNHKMWSGFHGRCLFNFKRDLDIHRET